MNEKRKALGDEREAYFPPKLKVFGPVGALTQAGTGMMGEGMIDPMGVLKCGKDKMSTRC